MARRQGYPPHGGGGGQGRGYSKTVNNRTGGLITSTGVVLMALVLVFVIPGVVLVVVDVVASHYVY